MPDESTHSHILIVKHPPNLSLDSPGVLKPLQRFHQRQRTQPFKHSSLYGERLLSPTLKRPNQNTIHFRLSRTHSVHPQILLISGEHFIRVQPEDAPGSGDRNPLNVTKPLIFEFK